MATDKPQFKVYLDPRLNSEIHDYAQRTGFKLGTLIERLWKLYQLQDFDMLADKIERYVKANPHQPGKSPAGLVRISLILNRWIKGPTT